MLTLIPEVLWAQRSSTTDESKNIVYLTLKVLDIEKPTIELTSTGLKFDGKTSDGERHYKLNLDFYDEIDAEKSKYSITGSKVLFVLYKKKLVIDYWPRLSKEKVKLHYVRTDFDRWVDEDEQDDKEDVAAEDLNGLNGMGDQLDFSKLMGGAGGAAGGAGGMPGMPDLSSLMGGAGGAGGMPDLSALMGGAGGAGGMPDLSALMGGAGGAGGAGGSPDFAAMLAKAKAEAESESSGLDEEDEGEEGQEVE